LLTVKSAFGRVVPLDYEPLSGEDVAHDRRWGLSRTGQAFFIGRTLDSTFSALKTVMIATDGEPIPPALISCLSQCGYDIVAAVASPKELLDGLRTLKPQLVLMTLEQDSEEKFSLLRQAIGLRTTAVVVLLKEWDSALAKKAMDTGVSGYMLQPFDAVHASATLESSWHHFQRLVSLQENLDLRKLLEKAKGILIKEQFISEEEAHQMILKMSQDQSIPLKDVCHSILQVKKILGSDKLKK
jgi:two-component system, response regulator PdtaR